MFLIGKDDYPAAQEQYYIPKDYNEHDPKRKFYGEKFVAHVIEENKRGD
jgi:hypothetical protein